MNSRLSRAAATQRAAACQRVRAAAAHAARRLHRRRLPRQRSTQQVLWAELYCAVCKLAYHSSASFCCKLLHRACTQGRGAATSSHFDQRVSAAGTPGAAGHAALLPQKGTAVFEHRSIQTAALQRRLPPAARPQRRRTFLPKPAEVVGDEVAALAAGALHDDHPALVALLGEGLGGAGVAARAGDGCGWRMRAVRPTDPQNHRCASVYLQRCACAALLTTLVPFPAWRTMRRCSNRRDPPFVAGKEHEQLALLKVCVPRRRADAQRCRRRRRCCCCCCAAAGARLFDRQLWLCGRGRIAAAAAAAGACGVGGAAVRAQCSDHPRRLQLPAAGAGLR